MGVVTRLTKSPEERRAAKARSQARWRAKQQIKTAVDASAGLIPGGSTKLPANITVKDVADVLIARGHGIIETMPVEQLVDKDTQPFIANMLRAQGVKDAQKREKSPSGGGLILAFLKMLDAPGPVLALDDGNVIDGEAVELGEAD